MYNGEHVSPVFVFLCALCVSCFTHRARLKDMEESFQRRESRSVDSVYCRKSMQLPYGFYTHHLDRMYDVGNQLDMPSRYICVLNMEPF